MEWAANDFVKNKKINIYDICYVFKTSSQIFYKLVYYVFAKHLRGKCY